MWHALIGAGGNIDGPAGPPAQTLKAARHALARAGVHVRARSRSYVSDPWGGVRQPPFLNEVWAVVSPLGPADLLALLLAIERRLGRRRRKVWGPRAIDLDLLACGAAQGRWPGPPALELPHPRMTARSFVLIPLADVVPRWRAPGDGVAAAGQLVRLGPAARASVRPASRVFRSGR